MPERIPNGVAKRVVFRAIASADHFTPKTGVTIAITISKNGGAFGNPAAGATNATEISSGFYYFDLGTGDTGTNGPLAWRGAVATIDDVGDVYEVVAATNAGFSALPATACTTNGSLITSGTGTAQLSVSSGLVTLAGVTHTGAVIPTVTTVTNQLTAAQIATGVWQDATAGDFTTASSIGKALYIDNVAPGGSGGHLISGSNAGTTTLGALTVTGATTLTGAVSFGSTFGVTGATTLAGLTTGALAATTITASGAVAFQSTFGVTGTTTLAALGTGAFTPASMTVAGGITAAITGSLSGSVGSVGAGGIAASTFAAGAIDAAAIAAGAIDNATFAADVGSTAIATNVIGIAAKKGVIDALTVDTYAELAAVPAATSTIKDKLVWLFMLGRNKITQTATTGTIRNDADGADIATSTTSDNGTTAVRGEWT